MYLLYCKSLLPVASCKPAFFGKTRQLNAFEGIITIIDKTASLQTSVLPLLLLSTPAICKPEW